MKEGGWGGTGVGEEGERVERRGKRDGSGPESFENFAGVICVRSDLPHSQLIVSCCQCVSRVGFDREVENRRMSLR